jgi:hypothetical protein
MREQILRHTSQPAGAQRVEARLFEGSKDLRPRLIRWQVSPMDGVVVKPLSDRETIAECPQPAERRRVRQGQHGFGFGGTAKRPRAGANCFDCARRECRGHD